MHVNMGRLRSAYRTNVGWLLVKTTLLVREGALLPIESIAHLSIIIIGAGAGRLVARFLVFELAQKIAFFGHCCYNLGYLVFVFVFY